MTPPRTRRNVLVTGASRGIGRAVAQTFAAAGDAVAVHASADGEDIATTLTGLTGVGHVSVFGDVANPEQCRAIVQEAAAGLGYLDVLVNNAGVAPGEQNKHRVENTPFTSWVEAWEQMVRVNLLGAAHVTWAFAEQFTQARGPGAVINIGSRGAQRGEPDHPAYASSKAALHAFGQSAAITLAPLGVSVVSVAPGVTATERQRPTLEGPRGAALRAQSPFDRVAVPQEIADAVLYLASPAAQWSSGSVVDLNGASYLRP